MKKMKKINDIDEFLKQLEETLGKMLDEIDISEDRPIDIGISVNICPIVVLNSQELYHPTESSKTAVDILETEKKVHAVVGLPGMELGDIKITCKGKVLEITASNSQDTLKETIELPARVNKTGMKATCNNGILELVFNKSKIKRPIKKSNA
jgi:HSP20 family molecular chaperone IbpA